MWGPGIGEISQSFLVSNRFSEADPALGQAVPCLSGTLRMSSSGGGLILSFRDLVVGCGTSANCPIANLYTITGTDSAVSLTFGVCVLTVATMGASVDEVWVEIVGWVSTPYLVPSFGYHGFSFVREICFGSWGSPDSGVDAWLGWSWLVLLLMGWL